ncbi:hypothetical protein GGR57DRAFT_350884 [Xylariaceae sp. FL1272]|nr:hypothetical protein GGR57DRAFT_350884 [Xylariaceae sp. FL1272]
MDTIMGLHIDTINDGRPHRSTVRSSREKNKGDDPADIGIANPPACIFACFDQFVGNGSIVDACHRLQRSENQTSQLWTLYCCDSTNCGVYDEHIGLSPSVDRIIGTCQNNEISSIIDPGPPRTGYCAQKPSSSVEAWKSPTGGMVTAESVAPTISIQASTTTTPVAVETTSTTTTASKIFPTSDPATSGTEPSTSLSGGAKAAIGVFSFLALLAVTAILLFLFRRRTKRRSMAASESLVATHRQSSPYSEPPSGSQTPLILPPPTASTRNLPLTPPARLSDRRYLQSILKNGALYHSDAPSTSQLVPPSATGHAIAQNTQPSRHEQRATMHSIVFPLATEASAMTHYAQSSVYSLNSGQGHSTVTVQSNKASSIHSGSATITGTSTPPQSPTRLGRSLDEPEIFDPVNPSGPPPTRALPAPPLNHPNSPTFSVSSMSPRSPTFSARSAIYNTHPTVSSKHGSVKTPSISASTKELCELTESYAREARESWGSWSGVGGGGPGVQPLGRKRGSGSPRGGTEQKAEPTQPAVIEELDMEKLGGRY